MRSLTILLVVSLAACSSIRSSVRTMWNEEREGTKAPQVDLSTVVWVNGGAEDLQTDSKWTVFVFFRPN